VLTHSLHWIAHPDFRRAIADFLEDETPHIEAHIRQGREMLPYKQSSDK